jgi:predicted DNA-binding WGR domain protein
MLPICKGAIRAFSCARGRIVSESYDSEALAVSALQKQAESKRRRGYAAAAKN